MAIWGILYLKKHNEKIAIKKDATMWTAAIFETLGQFFYVFAMAADSTINASIVGSYCILSLLLSSIFLKEKLSVPKYIFLTIAIVGGIYDLIIQNIETTAVLQKMNITLLRFSDLVELISIVYGLLGVGIGIVGSSISMKKYLEV